MGQTTPLKSTVSTHAIWIELGLTFQCSPLSKIRFGEYSSLEQPSLYQANKAKSRFEQSSCSYNVILYY